MAIKKAKIITITSVKGGTGKTTTTLNLAGTFTKQKQKTLIIDMDLYSGGIALNLGIETKKDLYKLVYDLYNNDFNTLEDYTSKYSEYIDVLSCPKDPRLVTEIDSKYISVVLSKARTKYDIILIDTNHIIDEINLIVMDYSDLILYVMNNDLVDIKNMKTMISIFSDMEKDNYRIILNNSKDKNIHKFSNYDIKNIIKSDINYIIPESFNLKNFENYIFDKKILTLDKQINKKHKKTIKIFDEIASDILKGEKNG